MKCNLDGGKCGDGGYCDNCRAAPKRDTLGRPYYTEAIHPRKKGGRVLKKTKRRK